MYEKRIQRTLIILFACTMFACAFAAAPLVHKHFPGHQSPPNEYDASCYWVKAEKEYRNIPAQPLVACAGLLLFIIVTQPLIARRLDVCAPVRSIFTPKNQIPRAPPAC